MLSDTRRTLAYKQAIEDNAEEHFKGKVVLDAGCGTGILSHFAAAAGARKVYAVEASTMAEVARTIVKDNGREDVIEVIQGKLEDIELPEKVDVIVSEWMGYFLYYESMFQSVLEARDKWLKPDGVMYPSHCNLYFAPIRVPELWRKHVDSWTDQYGVNMSAIIPLSKAQTFSEPLVEYIWMEELAASPMNISSVAAKTVTAKEIEDIHRIFRFSSDVRDVIHGFGSWFDVGFAPSPKRAKEAADNGEDDGGWVVLSTAPIYEASDEEYTHWAQSVMVLNEPIKVSQDSVISGEVRLTRSKTMVRALDVDVTFAVDGGEDQGKSWLM